MDAAKRRLLESRGYRVGDAADFLEMGDAEREELDRRSRAGRAPGIDPAGMAAALADRGNVASAVAAESSVFVGLASGPKYEVRIEWFEEDEGDPIGDKPMRPCDGIAGEVSDRASLLDAVLEYMARHHAPSVMGLATDGDREGCEAIFKFDGLPTIIKVR